MAAASVPPRPYSAGPRMKLALLVPDSDFFWINRSALAEAARDAGAEVVVLAPPGTTAERYREAGFRLRPVALARSANPFRALGGLLSIRRALAEERPDILHNVSMRAILLGSAAAWLAGRPATLNLVTGLGYVFISGPLLLRSIVRLAYRVCLRLPRSITVFQNPDDQVLFCSTGLARRDRVALIRGSGVDVARFHPAPEPDGPPVVLLAARMLWDKGVAELVEAGCELRRRGVAHRILLAGWPDEDNPAAIPAEQLRTWEEEGVVELLGRRDDMPALLQQCHVACLPSYREGVPLFLLEAAASGRPIVASDAPGCREVVQHGGNGYLVPVRESAPLADALERLLRDAALRREMGSRSRAIAEEEFATAVIVAQTFAVYRRLNGGRWPPTGDPAGRC